MLFTHLLMVAPAWGKKSTFPFAVIVRLVMGAHTDLRRAGVEAPGFL